MQADNINAIESEAGVIATLIHHPDYVYFSESLLPNHFTNRDNQCVYTAICDLVRRDIYVIDAYNIIEDLNSSESTRKFAESLTVDRLDELVDMSTVLARHSVEEYKLLADNVMDAAFRRDAYLRLKECESLCLDRAETDVGQKIYAALDDVMMEFSTAEEVPQYKDVVDDYWEEICSRQSGDNAGIPFKFKTLNEYARIEPGELFVFAANAKGGKSMMLLNCAVDLLKRDKAVLYVDSELNTRLFTARMLSHLSGIEYRNLISGNYTEDDAQKIQQARDWLKTKNFVHLYMPMFDLQTIYSTVRKVQHTMGLDVLIVDYFKSSGEGNAFDSYQELGKFTDGIKNHICGALGICGLGAAQATADGRIADSVKIARNASTIAIITDKSPEEIEADGEECGNKKMRVIYNRNGMQHTSGEYIDLKFDGNHILYEEAKQHTPQTPY